MNRHGHRHHEYDRGKDRNFAAARKRDGDRCLYCGAEAECVDHVVPWSYSRDNRLSNLASSCTACNLTASDHLFEDFADKAFNILRRRGLLHGFEATNGAFILAGLPATVDGMGSTSREEWCARCEQLVRLTSTGMTGHEGSSSHLRASLPRFSCVLCRKTVNRGHSPESHADSARHVRNVKSLSLVSRRGAA